MKNKIFKILIQISEFFYQRKIDLSVPVVLIHESSKKRQEHFVKSLKGLIEQQLIQVVFTTNKLKFLALSKYANFIFSYGLSRFMDTTNLRFVYIGEVGQTERSSVSIPIFNAPNFVSGNISDYIVASVFSYERGILQNLWLRNNLKWDQKSYVDLTGKNLQDLKIGILGLGNIGFKCADSFKKFDCEVHGFDKIEVQKECVDYFYSVANLNLMLNKIDYLIVTLSNNGNYHFLDEYLISQLNTNCCIVNISRGNLIDESALISAIKKQRIRGAILDVLEKEPLNKRSELWNLDGIIISPHIAGNIDLVFDKIALDFSEKINESLTNV